MTAMLASVRSLEEARIAFDGGADIVDLKEPLHGALGAVPHRVARSVSDWIAGRIPVSATIGDLSGDNREIVTAVESMAGCGVDIVKVGLFDREAREATLQVLAPMARAGTRLVAVLFADRCTVADVADVRDIAAAGFFGAMIDTASKRGHGLRNCLDAEALRAFTSACRQVSLVSGLAGSLGLSDVEVLLPLLPDYLGFRGALCRGDQRDQEIDTERLRSVRASIPQRVSGQSMLLGA